MYTTKLKTLKILIQYWCFWYWFQSNLESGSLCHLDEHKCLLIFFIHSQSSLHFLMLLWSQFGRLVTRLFIFIKKIQNKTNSWHTATAHAVWSKFSNLNYQFLWQKLTLILLSVFTWPTIRTSVSDDKMLVYEWQIFSYQQLV